MNHRFVDYDAIALVLLICVPLTLFGGVIAMGYWDNQQTRVMYQTAYQKNMECRVATQKSGYVNSIDRICGAVPKFEDYVND